MKALVQHVYGAASSLVLEDVPEPVPGEGEVLVRVRATSVNPYDWHFMRGEPYVARLMTGGFGLRRPPVGVLGCDLAGRVETAGTRFAPGDDVYALLPRGAHAEYVCVREDLLAPMPANLTHEQAAAMPMAAVTALVALRGVEAGQRVLVNGASGGVGTFAVQLAKALGAQVDAVCGAANAEMVRSLGAGHVFDYRAEDFTRSGRGYDVVLDIAGSRSVFACRRVLARDGTFVAVGGPAGRWVQPAGHVFSALASGPLARRRVVLADAVACADKAAALGELAGMVERGAVTPVIDRSYPFDDLREAFAYQEAGHARGKVVVTIGAPA
ncbi:NADPH:quinone reductase and related Zn-dependent oxidoreductase [Amycolatopsis mediterranei S699]|uniref:NADPH:quinone reductase and related Zn-dependent oxidoreductase n=2 Tax=Amycolatopsis mediterranei TaxID=33910 RepID=A0A0H3DG87_AMYMU|nr:NAD(P)-dependent alcohol dehydrogenase [Amycolatopsis mediterranei]ADJ49207.1 NADPH:quinone reductase and related Zn-dependent oxidoreductase [Amycolatopsis mediterranei U32]AEK46169.1 NADPH:quinone reductase and related Zn-dependent oxidoreductase [Amycolatopsis mediterranei S699]AFO80915.1 NADPH:quinone reductase and related Zn-dependent oxidoreductase [Amycolatopsis mediterranei S699]AGT88043.1 NADPH:quinone reductase-related Zn-dependent oxidoreductase [Amycolatopsis mediterranei RB]KDO